METKWIILIVYIATNCLILAPIYIYWTYRFYQHKNDIIMSKRTPTLTIIFCIIGVCTTIIERPCYLFTLTYSDVHAADIISSNESALIKFIYFLATFLFACLQATGSWILFLRYWMIYFNVSWTRHTLNKGWIIHLNHLDLDHNWFLSNKSRCGNFKYNLKIMGVVYLIVSIIWIIFHLFIHSSMGNSMATFIAVLLAIVPIIGVYVLGCKIRNVQDHFNVIKEFNVISIFVSVYIVSYLIIGGVLPYALKLSAYGRGLCVILLSTVASACFMYLQTIYVLKWAVSHNVLTQQLRLNSDEMSYGSGTEHELSHTTTDLARLDSVKSASGSSRTRKKTTYGTLLANVVDDINKFENFMLHLSKEWSMELLLFAIEAIQLQNIIKEEYKEIASEDMKFNLLQNAVAENKEIPLSFIVYHENITDILNKYNVIVGIDYDKSDKLILFKLRCCAIYQKYIEGDE
eukprot:334268_1